MISRKRSYKEIFATSWEGVFCSVCSEEKRPHDATIFSYMRRYPSSMSSTKPRVVFIKMLSPLFSVPPSPPLKESIRFLRAILPAFSHPFQFLRLSYPNFDFVWIMRAYRLIPALPDYPREKGKRIGGGGEVWGNRRSGKGWKWKGAAFPSSTRLNRCTPPFRNPQEGHRSFSPLYSTNVYIRDANWDITSENQVVEKVKAMLNIKYILL